MFDAVRQLPAYLSWKDGLDIAIVTVLVYAFLVLLRRTHSRFVVNGISMLFGLYLVSRALNLYLTTTIFQTFLAFFVIIIVVIFQREFRHFFEMVYIWGKPGPKGAEAGGLRVADELVEATGTLAAKRIGALIVIPGRQPVDRLTRGGITVNGRLSVPLLLSIFDPSSPGHDGAVIIEGDRIRKFGVHLPLSENFEKYRSFGTRHRAALGLAESSDALVIAVSEERGTISVAEDGVLTVLSAPDALKERLDPLFRERYGEEAPSRFKGLWTKNIREKLMALAFAFFFWFLLVVQLGGGEVTRELAIPVEFRFLPTEYAVSAVSSEKISVWFRGRNQDFNLLDPEALRVIVNLSRPTEGTARIVLTEALVNRPAAINVVRFSPRSLEFKIEKSIKE